MQKTCLLALLLILSAFNALLVKAQTPTVVYTNNFDYSTFTTATAYGTPPTTYKFTLGGTSTINTTLVSGSNYRANINSGSTANRSLFVAPLAPFSAPNTIFSRQLSSNYGLVTWTFNMRTSNAVTTSTPTSGAISGGIDLCGNAAANIYNGAPTGYGVVFNSGATGGVNLIRFSAGMLTNVTLITGTTTMPKTDYYSVRVTYNPATNQWSLYVRDDGAAAFADPSSGVTTQQGSTITDATYTNNVQVNFGAVYGFTAGTGKTMSVDNFQVAVTLPACTAPGIPTGLSYTNTATSTSVSFTPPGTAPTGYILVMSSGPLAGNPTNGQAITVGTAVGSNGTIVGTGTSSPVATSTALTGNTNYTMTLFPYNNTGCGGGPFFNTSVSSNSITTCPNAPTLTSFGLPSASIIPAVSWSAPAAGGGVYSTYTYLLNVYTDPGLTIPAPGYPSGGTTVTSPYDLTSLTSGVTYYWTITAVDSACNSAPSASNTTTTSIVPCAGYPNPGTASTSAGMVTGSTTFNLGLVGASGETGISFQWQSSVCGSTWTNIGSPLTSANFTTSETGPTLYQCVVTCANSGLISTSNPIYVGRTNAAYCFPTSTNGCSLGDGVNEFTMAGACGTSISDPGPLLCTGINLDHTGYTPIKLYAGSSYAATVNSNFDGDDVYVWIDFNNDGIFSSSEIVYSTNTAVVPGLPFTYSFSIPIPTISSGATPGIHRMRVVADQAQVLSTGCDALTYGTSVDYTVQIIPNLSLSYNSPLCLPSGLTLTASPALACGSTYTWSGPSGYNNVTPNTNTINPPAVAGTYSVSVSVNGISSCPSAATTTVTAYSTPVITGVTGMCVGSLNTLTTSVTGGAWTSSNAGIASVVSGTGAVSGVATGAATISYTAPSGCLGTSPMTVTNTPGVYTVTGGGNYCSGGAGVHIGLSGSDAGVSYQLYLGGVPAGSTHSGTGSALDFGLITASGTYTITANPGTSCSTVMTGNATVSILSLPTLYNVTGGGNYCPGTSGVHVGLNGSQSGVSYQLYLNGTATGLPYTGTGPAIDFGLATGAGTYNIIATNLISGCSAVMNSSATVSLNPIPALQTVTGGGAFCAGGTGVHIGLSGSASGTNYKLYTGGVPYGTSTAGTGTSIDLGLVPAAGTYTVLATTVATGCSDSMIGYGVVTINPAPTPFTVTGGGNYCAGAAGLHIGLGSSVIGTSYNLYNSGSLISSASGTGAPLDFGLQTAGGTYTITGNVGSTGCTGNMTGSAAIVVNALPAVFTVSGGGGYCTGSAAPHVQLSGSTTGVTYQVFNMGSPTGAAINGSGSYLDLGAQTTAGNYTVAATVTATGCMGTMSGSVSVSVNIPPSGYLITGGGNYCAGGTGVHIGLINTDTGIHYQLRNGALNIGSALAGTGSGIDFGLQTGSGVYTVAATSNTGSCTVNMPGSATVTISAAPTAYNMTGGGNYCSGGAGKHIGLASSNTGINYQLYNGTTAAGAAVGGGGLQIDFGLQTAPGVYTVMATNATTTCSSIMNLTKTIGITPLPTAYTVTGGGNICPAGPGAHVGLSGSDAGVTYQLYNGVTSVGSAVTGTGAALDLGAQTTAGLYSVIATNPTASCTNNMTGTAAISFYSLPSLHNVTGGGSFYCAGGTGVHIGLDGSDAGNTYQLYNGTTLTGAPVAGTGYALDFGLQLLAGTYTVMATSGLTGCSNSMPGTATVSVSGQPIIHVITGGGNYCPGTSGVHIGLNGSETGIVYQLYNGITTSGSPVAGTGAPLDLGSYTTTGSYSIMATNISTGCSVGMAGSATVGVSSLPAAYTVTGGGSYCAGGPGISVFLSWSDAGINYTLYNGGIATATTMAGTGAPLNFGLQPGGNYTIAATSSTTTCTNNMTGSAIITANPLPDTFIVSGGGSYCAGGTGLSVMLGGSETGVNYQLYAGSSATGSPVAGTGSSINFGLQTAAGSYTIKGTKTGTGCVQTMTGAAAIVAIPLPASYIVTGGGNYCTGGAGQHIGLGGSTSGVTYQLYNGTTATGVPQFGTGTAIDFGLQNAAGIYTVSATDLTTTCMQTMGGSATINTLPLPAAYTVTGGGSYCAGGAGADIKISGSATGINYQLSVDGITLGSPLPGSGSELDFGMQTTTGTYIVTASNSSTGCTSYMTGSATVAMGAIPSVYTVSGSSAAGYCAGGAGVIVYLNNSDMGVNYQLYRGATSVTTMAGTGTTISFGPQSVSGTYTIVAHNAVAGCTSNMSGGVNVYVNPAPLIYNVTGGGGFCSGGAGAHIELTGSETGVTYQAYHLGTPTGLSETGTGAGLDLGAQILAGSYNVVATNTGTGCTSNMAGSASVFVNPAPSTFTVTGGGSFCTGSAGVHVGLSGSAAGTTYQLLIGGATSGSPIGGSGLPVDFGVITVPGLYTVSATVAATGCSAVMASGTSVTALSLPAPYPVSGGGSYCSGGTGVAVALSGSNTGVTYSLYNGSTLIGSPVAGSGFGLNFGLQTGGGTYTVIATDGATSCHSTMPGTAVVLVNPLPDTYTLTGGGNYCAGGTGVAVGLAGSTPGISYTLYYGTSALGTLTGTGTVLNFGMQTGAGSYTIHAENPGTTCASIMAGAETISITPVVTPSVLISTGSGDTLCNGTLTTFAAISTNGGTTPAYQWTVNGILTGSGMTYSYTPANGDVVGVTFTSSAACATPLTVTGSAAITVFEKEMPGITVSANPGIEVCLGNPVDFTATPSYGGSAPSFVWMKGTTIMGTGPNFSYLPSAGDVITCKMTSNYLCRLANTATSAPADMIVDTPGTPVVTIAAYPGLRISAGETVTLEATVTKGGPAPTFQWLVNGVTVPGATMPSFTSSTLNNNDIVACNATSSGGCAGTTGSSAVTLQVIGVGVPVISTGVNSLAIFPNPNHGSFEIKGSLENGNQKIMIEVRNILGQAIFTREVNAVNAKMDEMVQLGDNIAPGMYLLSVQSGAETMVYHVVVEQ